jgi:hypothetical protein
MRGQPLHRAFDDVLQALLREELQHLSQLR